VNHLGCLTAFILDEKEIGNQKIWVEEIQVAVSGRRCAVKGNLKLRSNLANGKDARVVFRRRKKIREENRVFIFHGSHLPRQYFGKIEKNTKSTVLKRGLRGRMSIRERAGKKSKNASGACSLTSSVLRRICREYREKKRKSSRRS